MANGWTCEEMFSNETHGFALDDILLMPGYISFGVDEVQHETRLSRRIKINNPLVSAPIHSVTDSEMAIAMALSGGVGIIHDDMSIADQCNEVGKVKRFENGFIVDPITVPHGWTIRQLKYLMKFVSYHCYPVVKGMASSIDTCESNEDIGNQFNPTNGSQRRLVGIIERKDVDFVSDLDGFVHDYMTPLDDIPVKVCTSWPDVSLKEANDIMMCSKISMLPIISEDGDLLAVVSRKDLVKNEDYPYAVKTKNKQLLVGAVVTLPCQSLISEKIIHDTWNRITALVSSSVDIIILASPTGSGFFLEDLIKRTKEVHSSVDVMVGYITTREQAKRIIDAGADALLVGKPELLSLYRRSRSSMKCFHTTFSQSSPIGVSEASGLYRISRFIQDYSNLIENEIENRLPIPICFAGSLSNSGHIIKALALGASTVMLDRALLGTTQTPGIYSFHQNVKVKVIKFPVDYNRMYDSSIHGIGSCDNNNKSDNKYTSSRCHNSQISNKADEVEQRLMMYAKRGVNTNLLSSSETTPMSSTAHTPRIESPRENSSEDNCEESEGKCSEEYGNREDNSDGDECSYKYTSNARFRPWDSRDDTPLPSSLIGDRLTESDVIGMVPDKGSVHSLILFLLQGVRHGFQDMGQRGIESIHNALFNGQLRGEIRSSAGLREGGVSQFMSSQGNSSQKFDPLGV